MSNESKTNTNRRFTGLKDIDGNEIYENDRLKPSYGVIPEIMSDEEIQETLENCEDFSNPVVRWVPERCAFYLVSERFTQSAPKIVGTYKNIHADYEVDHIRTVRFTALTKFEASHWIVYGNTIDNPDDSDHRVLPPKAADDFSDFYEEEKTDDGKDDD